MTDTEVRCLFHCARHAIKASSRASHCSNLLATAISLSIDFSPPSTQQSNSARFLANTHIAEIHISKFLCVLAGERRLTLENKA